MVLFSIVTAVVTGRTEQITHAAFEGAGSAVTIVMGFMGITSMWNGLMKIAEDSNLIKKFSKLISPLTEKIFNGLGKHPQAMEAVSANMIANMLGLANAATPLGIKAMKELDAINGGRSNASENMCMLAVVNSASIQLIPSTLIGIRASMGSKAPAEIIVPVWIVSVCAFAIAVFGVKLCAEASRRKAGKSKWKPF